MSVLRIKTEWEDPKRAKGLELRATWGSLLVEVEHAGVVNTATRHYDRALDAIRGQVYAPLYPLAEWIAFHWFQLLHGAERFSDERNHDIRFGAEGFALPKLRLWSEGSDIRVAWSPTIDETARIEFLGGEEFALPRAPVEQELADFLNRVASRLQECGINDTPLQEEWAAILAMDSEERDYCVAAANLGLDPFDLPEMVEMRILKAGALVPQDIQEEFFPAASGESVLEEAEALASAIRELDQRREQGTSLDRLRSKITNSGTIRVAWQAGYELAHQTREALAIPSGRANLDTLISLTSPHSIDALSRLPRVEGLISRNCANSGSAVAPSFDQRRVESKKFATARLLCEALLLSSSRSALLTKERTTRQKLNRAFAAELLAPASELRTRVTGSEISQEEIQELAEEYEVSSYVIENQIKNHSLAAIVT
jgi:hypothetical protein